MPKTEKNNSDQPYTRLSGVFKVFGVLMALILISTFYHTFRLWQVRQTWKMVKGQVVRKTDRGWWDEERQKRYYVAYAYEVDGKRHTATRFHLKEDSLKGYGDLRSLYREGDPIFVYYNPEHPEASVLSVAYLRNGFVFITLVIGFLVLAGTHILKETRWQRQTDTLLAGVPRDDNGRHPLPPSPILTDSGLVLRLDTGLSGFWTLGIPFLGMSMLGVALMVVFLPEINPGWSLKPYAAFVLITWGAGLLVAGFMKRFKHGLEVDGEKREIRETNETPFGGGGTPYGFSQVQELRLYREKWRHDNPLRNWILYIQLKSRKSLPISLRHRDLQPGQPRYLDLVKKRIEYLVSGSRA